MIDIASSIHRSGKWNQTNRDAKQGHEIEKICSIVQIRSSKSALLWVPLKPSISDGWASFTTESKGKEKASLRRALLPIANAFSPGLRPATARVVAGANLNCKFKFPLKKMQKSNGLCLLDYSVSPCPDWTLNERPKRYVTIGIRNTPQHWRLRRDSPKNT